MTFTSSALRHLWCHFQSTARGKMAAPWEWYKSLLNSYYTNTILIRRLCLDLMWPNTIVESLVDDLISTFKLLLMLYSTRSFLLKLFGVKILKPHSWFLGTQLYSVLRPVSTIWLCATPGCCIHLKPRTEAHRGQDGGGSSSVSSSVQRPLQGDDMTSESKCTVFFVWAVLTLYLSTDVWLAMCRGRGGAFRCDHASPAKRAAICQDGAW